MAACTDPATPSEETTSALTDASTETPTETPSETPTEGETEAPETDVFENSGLIPSEPVTGSASLSKPYAEKITTTDGSVTFQGTYRYGWFHGGDRTKFAMGANNTLYYPDEDFPLGPFRAFFRLNNATQAPSRIVMNVNGEPVATDILHGSQGDIRIPTPSGEHRADSYKFIRNGRIYIRRNGVTYDLMGRSITSP